MTSLLLADEIMETIKQSGFHIAARQETTMSREVVEQMYKDAKDRDYYEDLVNYMTRSAPAAPRVDIYVTRISFIVLFRFSGPTLFMVLSGRDAVTNWRQTMGPTDPEEAKAVNENS